MLIAYADRFLDSSQSADGFNSNLAFEFMLKLHICFYNKSDLNRTETHLFGRSQSGFVVRTGV